MSRTEKNKKKALIVFALLFFVFGGGLSVYFMSSGIDDLKDFDKKSKFSYGFNFKKAVMPFFEALGFSDGEDTRKKSKSVILSGRESDDLYDVSSGAASAKSSRSPMARKKDSGYKGPKGKLSSKNRGLKRGGKSGSKSSAGRSNFSSGGSRGDVSISRATLAAKEKAESTKAYVAMKRTNSLLAQTHRTNSSMEAKSKWGKSFRGEGAATGRMTYKGGAVELDEMSTSVLDLKKGKEGTLGIPDVGAPKEDSSGSEDPALKALAESANPLDGVVNSLFKATAKSAGNTIGSGEDVPPVSPAAVIWAKKQTQPGETAKVMSISCGATPTFCSNNNITGGYYQASYDGQDDWSKASVTFKEGENGDLIAVGGDEGWHY